MNHVKELICIVCPKGCRLQVDEQLNVTGQGCPRGVIYGKTELLAPKRLLASTVKICSSQLTRLPVVTSGEIPKDQIFAVMAELNKITVSAPVKLRQVIISNILGLQVDLIATRSVIK